MSTAGGVVSALVLNRRDECVQYHSPSSHFYFSLFCTYCCFSTVAQVIPADLINTFSDVEMELLTCGLPEVDVDDMRAHCEYRGFNESHPAVQWFWQVVREEFDREQRALLLQFVTGTSRVPARGFAHLQVRKAACLSREAI